MAVWLGSAHQAAESSSRADDSLIRGTTDGYLLPGRWRVPLSRWGPIKPGSDHQFH